jgi:beta-lactam-binding protein with PASTA domain
VQVKQRQSTDQGDEGIVLEQRPGHGTQLKKGRTVVIYVGKYKAPPPKQQTQTNTTPTTTTPGGTTPPATGIGTG